MGQQKNKDMSMEEVEIKIVEDPQQEESTQEASQDADLQQEESKQTEAEETSQAGKTAAQTGETTEDKGTKKSAKKSKQRSQKYQAVRSKVDKTRSYDPFSAVELVKKLSYSEFPGTITVHLVLKDNFQGERVDFEFPHQTGKTLRVEIANEKTLKKVAAGEIDFDVLLATPAMMPKLAKLAPILGPKGLMPNPKQGTLLKNPKERKKELESGKITLHAERNAPLMHVVLGNTETETKKLVENLQALIKVLERKLKKVSLAATMSPGVKVEIQHEEELK